MKKAIMYGAGNIGRGFIGKTFSESGYEVCFIDVNQKIVDQLNQDHQYPVRVVFNDEQREEIVKNVRAVNGTDIDKVADEIADADIMATAVGVNVLPKIVKPICAGLRKRFCKNREPLNIIICENMIEADKYLRKLIEDEMGEEYKELLDESLGLVEASIGRMVPLMTDEMREGNMLRVWVEPYDELPVDKDAFKGMIPKLKGLIPFSPFGYYIKRKLFIHNMGHAMSAYLGWQQGYKYIYECIEDAEIRVSVYEAMMEIAKALNHEYHVPLAEVEKHIKDLLYRFGNRTLGDTIERVGRDSLRKLGPNDRLVGAAQYCNSQGITPNFVIKGIVAGLKYNNIEDETVMQVQDMIKKQGISAFLKERCGIRGDATIYKDIIQQY